MHPSNTPDSLEKVHPIDFSLIIACYCEEPHLMCNVKKLANYFLNTTLVTEFIFVEDASPDQTKKVVEDCLEWLKSETHIQTSVIFHPKNMGRGKSVQDGFNIARGKAIGFIDIDLEHPLDALLPMILRIFSGDADGLIGHRFVDINKVSWLRMVLSSSYKFLAHILLPLPVSDTEAGLKVFQGEKIKKVLPSIQNHHWFWDTEICIRAAAQGLRLKDHCIVYVKNKEKKSTVKVISDSFSYLLAILHFKFGRNI